MKTKNAELEESLASAQKVSTLKQIEDLKLRRDYDSAVAILEQIPAEVLNIYAQSSHRGKERPIDAKFMMIRNIMRHLTAVLM